MESGVYIIQNGHNHNWAVISDTNDYSEVISGTDTGNNIGNKWHLKRLQNKTYTLKNDLFDYYATYGITDDFDRPVMSMRTSNPQQWRIEVCNGFYIISELDGCRCWTLGDDFLGTPIELRDYTRSNRQHWAIRPDDQDHGTLKSVVLADTRPLDSEHVPSQRVNDAPFDLLAVNFTGRLKDLDFLLQVFGTQNVVTGEDVPTRCAVHGMPGVGKTNLVLRFAQIVFSRLLCSHVFWMSAATPEKLIEGMAKILDLVRHSERFRPEQNSKLTSARLWLEDFQPTEGDGWLLILDNVDQTALEFLREHLPRRNAKGNILFTTRAADVADALVRVSRGRHSTLKLRVPDLVETTHLLFSGAGIDANTVTPEQQNQAEQLVQNLGSLPLAVVQVASYMRQTDMTVDRMLQMFRGERKIEIIGWESSLAADQQRSVVATFDTVLNQLERDAPEAYGVLRILSFLDPENISFAMLADGAQMLSPLLDKPLPGSSQDESRNPQWPHSRRPSQRHSQNNSNDPASPTHLSSELRALISLLLSPTAFPSALHKLRSLSLVERLSRDGELSLRVHDLVHFITQEHVKQHTAYHVWLESAVSLVCGAIRHVEDPKLPKCWQECENLMPHVRFLGKVWTGVGGVNLELVMADVRLAQYLNSRGRYDDAGRLCERSVRSLREKLGEKHQDTLSAFYLLALIHYNQGRIPEAEETFGRVLADRKKELGANHEDTLMTMNNLALVYHQQNRYKEAKQLFKRVLAVEKKSGPDHPSTLTTMHNLALVYRSQKRYDKAEELFKDVLALKEKNLGPDHVNTLTAAINLGSVYRSQTKYVEAEQLFERALVGREKQLGDSHPHTLTAVLHLAHLYQSQARDNEAEPLFLRAFTGMKRYLGANHRKTLECAEAFSVFYRSQGRNTEADALLEEVGRGQGE